MFFIFTVVILADLDVVIVYLQDCGLEKENLIFQHFFNPFLLPYVNFITQVPVTFFIQ